MTDCKEGLPSQSNLPDTLRHSAPTGGWGEGAQIQTWWDAHDIDDSYLLSPGGQVEAGVLRLPRLGPRLQARPPAQGQPLALHPQSELGALAPRRLLARAAVLKQLAVMKQWQ